MSQLQASCPICDEVNTLSEGTEATEIITCAGCQNRLVVSEISTDQATLEEAPAIEEDWGE